MHKSVSTVTIALCASMVAHWVLVYALAENEIKVLEKQTASGPIDVEALLRGRRRVLVAEASDPPPRVPDKKPFDLDLPPPEEAMKDEDLFGEHGGRGKSINSSPGDKPMQARQAEEDQAFLNHNPNANLTRPGENASVGSSGSGGSGGQDGGGGAPPAASPDVAILGFTPKDLENAPFGVPRSPPPSLLPPSELSRRQLAIAIEGAGGSPRPTTRRVEENPLNETTQSVVTREHSAATRPTEIDPTTRPADAAVAFATPSIQPAVDRATTEPSQIAQQPLNIEGPKGVLPTTREALAQLPTTLPTTRPVHPVAVAIASIGDALPHLDTPTVVAPPGAPGAPGNTGSAGHPGGAAGSEGGNKSESESDPFTSENSQNFAYVNGRVAAKDGRKVKTVRPHISESVIQDLTSLGNTRVDLIVRISADGKVTDVQIVPGRSSGSRNIDLAATLAAWDWEFEPPLDRVGKPRADVQIIPFIWR